LVHVLLSLLSACLASTNLAQCGKRLNFGNQANG
jgi:hypothetical protein